MPFNLITILGPTASGKTSLAALLAYRFKGEIISADSRQVYRRMDIGTGKDLDAYIIDNTTIASHLIDVAGPEEEFNLFLYLKHFHAAFDNITSRGKIPFLTGGTGLYLHGVLKGYSMQEVTRREEKYNSLNLLETDELREMLLRLKPRQHNTTDLTDKDRIIKAIITAQMDGGNIMGNGNEPDILDNEPKDKFPIKDYRAIKPLVIGINLERDLIKKRITLRLKERLNNGMIEEVRSLIESGINHEKLDFFGLEYRYISLYLKGTLNYNDMYQKLNSAIHSFAKRQMTWFRKMEREGIKIQWIEGPDSAGAEKIIRELYFQSYK